MIGLMLTASVSQMGEGLSALKNPTVTEWLIQEVDALLGRSVVLKGVTHPEGGFAKGAAAETRVRLYNPRHQSQKVTAELAVIDDSGSIKMVQIKELIVPARSETPVALELPLTEVSSTKLYTRVRVWEADQQNQLRLIGRSTGRRSVWVYGKEESFEQLDSSLWAVSDKTLGRTELRPENVQVADGKLQIKMGRQTLTGGEVYTRDQQGYGIYEVSMKLPRAPSSLTGFFFYEPPDFAHEIDIEVYNSQEGIFYLTTYDQGRRSNTYEGRLGFDPTADFHRYRIDYSEAGVSFYIDDEWIRTWTKGVPKRPMRLMVNSWHPDWLEGIPANQEEILELEWIRY